MKTLTRQERGQALVMVSLCLFAMCGVMGFAVDLGWSYFVKRAAQAAADAAVMAAAEHALATAGSTGVFGCGVTISCQAPTACSSGVASPPGSAAEAACLYARQNGFEVGGNGGRQTVSVEAGVSPANCADAGPPNCVPVAPGVAADYWVTVRVTETVPQLFSAVLGNATATVSARATAAIVDSAVAGSLILTNRQAEPLLTQGNQWETGVNVLASGNSTLDAHGGMLLASNCSGASCGGATAGDLSGNATVDSPFTFVRSGGEACAGNIAGCSQAGGSDWNSPYQNRPDGGYFVDPMRGRGQPPLGQNVLIECGFPNGWIDGGTVDNPMLLIPANYYATRTVKGKIVATGDPITLGDGHFQFVPCETCAPGSGFGDYVFYGGLRIHGGSTVVTLNPGRYVFAGQNRTAGSPLLWVDDGAVLQDHTSSPGRNSDAGELLIFTDLSYPGLQTQLANVPLVAAITSKLKHGSAGIAVDDGDPSTIRLHGLNGDHPLIRGTALEPFAPVVLWQDQANSRVRHLPDGTVDTVTCGGSLDSPCTNSPANHASRAMNLYASPDFSLYGAAYQPRGGWINVRGNGTASMPLQIIAGAIELSGNAGLSLGAVNNPVTRRVVALVE